MANLHCMEGDGEPAAALVTILADGTVYTLCSTHLVAFCAGLLSSMTGIDPAPFIEAISDDQPATEAETPAGVTENGTGSHMTAEGAPTDEPPAPAPHDTDQDPAGEAPAAVESPPPPVTEAAGA
jgi:hypothetical protein